VSTTLGKPGGANRRIDSSGGHLLRQAVRASDSYGLVLILLAMTFFALMLAPVGEPLRVSIVALQGVTTLFALRTSRVSPRVLRPAAIAFVVTLVALIAAEFSGVRSASVPGAAEVLSTLLLVTAPFAIMRHIIHDNAVDTTTVLGALCVYLLIGMVFAFVFAALDRVSPTPLFYTGRAAYADCLFFSFVTLTTTGYGNLVPALRIGQAFSMVEAVLGQVFLVTFVARLVSLYGMRRE